MSSLKQLREFVSEEKAITLLFLFSTCFYLAQHSSGYSWDFSAYALNARYMAGAGGYFELVRPPMTAFLIMLFSFASWLAAEYLYIILVSMLHLFSAMKFATAFGVDRRTFYLFSLAPFALAYGLISGTELLSLALLQLFLAYAKDAKAGAFAGAILSLATLARYTNILYLPLLALQRDAKKIVLSLILFAAVFTPWLLYSYATTGDALSSVADYYAINFLFRRGVYEEHPPAAEILFALNITAPLLLFGLARLRKLKENDVVMLAIFALVIVSYASAPLTYPRFLYNITLVAAYFAARNLRVSGVHATAFFAAVAVVLVFMNPVLEDPAAYKRLAGGEQCATQSNAWVALNYFGRTTEPFPYREALNDSVRDGYRIVLMKGIKDPAYVADSDFLHSFPVIEETDDYIILGNNDTCKNPKGYDETFLQRQNAFYAKYKKPINLTPIKALLTYSVNDLKE